MIREFLNYKTTDRHVIGIHSSKRKSFDCQETDRKIINCCACGYGNEFSVELLEHIKYAGILSCMDIRYLLYCFAVFPCTWKNCDTNSTWFSYFAFRQFVLMTIKEEVLLIQKVPFWRDFQYGVSVSSLLLMTIGVWEHVILLPQGQSNWFYCCYKSHK